MELGLSLKNYPIGIFDSGVGGLTVLSAIQAYLPNEDLMYLADTARVPYGTKSAESVQRYACQAASALVERGIKLLVVACNTASAVALPLLQSRFPEVLVVGVVLPGAQASCLASRSGHIAVIGTESTINGGAYQRAIADIRPDAKVYVKPCSLFVALAEEGWHSGDIVERVAQVYLEPIFSKQLQRPDCLVLGCTHFPVLKPTIQKIIGNDIAVVDSAATTARVVSQLLVERNLSKDSESSGELHCLVTDDAGRFARVAHHFFNNEISLSAIEKVDL